MYLRKMEFKIRPNRALFICLLFLEQFVILQKYEGFVVIKDCERRKERERSVGEEEFGEAMWRERVRRAILPPAKEVLLLIN